MSFTSPEFPGRTFESIEELRTMRLTKERFQEALSGKAIVTATVAGEDEEWETTPKPEKP